MLTAVHLTRAAGFLSLLAAFLALWGIGTWQTMQSLRREHRIAVTPPAVLALEYRDEEVALSRQKDARQERARAIGTLIVLTAVCAFVALILALQVYTALFY